MSEDTNEPESVLESWLDNKRHKLDCCEPDLRGPAVIVTGSVISGFEFYGPFETVDAAVEWYNNCTLLGSLKIERISVVILKKPNDKHALITCGLFNALGQNQSTEPNV